MYYYAALNKEAIKNKQLTANTYAVPGKSTLLEGPLITVAYHQLNNGKWNHMMDQTHIGYT